MATLTSQLILSLVDRVTAPVRAVEKSISSLQQKIAQNNRRLSELRGQMVEAAAVGYGLYRAIQGPVMAAVEFESAMADVRKVVDFPTPEAFAEMSRELVDMSTRIPMAADGLAAIAAAAGGSGMDRADILPFTEMVAKVGVAFDMAAGEVGTALTKIKTQLGMSVPELSALSDAINHLSNTSAARAPDIVDYMKRVGSVGRTAGFTAEQTAAIGSAMIATGAEADVAATSFRNVTKALTRGESATKSQLGAYADLGLEATSVAKGMQKDAVGTLNNVLARIRKLPKYMQNSVITDLFGDEARAIMPLVENAEVLEKALKNVQSQAEYLGSSQKEYDARAATTANNMQLFRNKIAAVGIAIGGALLPPLNDLMDKLSPLIKSIRDFAEANPRLMRSIIGVTAALIGLRVAAIAAQWSFAWMKGAALMSALAGMKALRAAIWAVQLAMLPFGAALRGAGSAMIAFAAASRIVGVGGALKIIGASALAALNPLRLLAGAVRLAGIALRVAFISTGVGAIIAGIAAAGIWIYNNWSGIGEMFSAFGRSFMAALGPAAPVIQKFWDGVKGIWDAVSGMLGPIDESGASWRAWGETLGVVAAGGVQQLLGALNTVIGALKGAYEWASNAAGAVASFFGAGGGGPAPTATGAGAKVEARASGGPIQAFKPYLVGERGPELIVPRAHGMVMNARNTAQAMQSRGAASISGASRATANARTPAGGGSGSQSGNSGPASITFGDINIQGGANATPQQIRREFSREASAIMRRHFSDGIT